jgi:DNA-binding response OmpR family regulator
MRILLVEDDLTTQRGVAKMLSAAAMVVDCADTGEEGLELAKLYDVLTKEAFLNHLYGGIDEPEVKIIDVFICKLRKKLAQAGAEDMIGTVWGRGYVLREPQPRQTHPAASEAPRIAAA